MSPCVIPFAPHLEITIILTSVFIATLIFFIVGTYLHPSVIFCSALHALEHFYGWNHTIFFHAMQCSRDESVRLHVTRFYSHPLLRYSIQHCTQ